MDLDKAIKNRRSIRKFKNKRLSRKAVKKIIEAGIYAPSACNMQMWHFVAVDDDKVKLELCEHAGCPQIINLAPTTIFVFYDKNVNKEHYANIQSAAAAIQNMLLKAYSMGIGSVWMCTYGNKEKVRRLLRVPNNFMLIAAVCLGYSDENPTPPKRREGVISFNTFCGNSTKYPTTFDPTKWTIKQIRDYRDFNIRAKSPASEEHRPELKGEFKTIIDEFQRIEGKTLDIFPYFANYTYALIVKNKLDNVTIYEMSNGVSRFLQNKFKSIKRKTKVKFKVGIDFNLPKNSFDTVLCLESLEKVPDPKKLISVAKNVLKKNGMLYILFINKLSVTGFVHKIRMMKGLPVEVPFKPLLLSNVKNLIKNEGFEIVDVVGINIIPRTKFCSYTTRSLIKQFCKFVLIKARKR